MLHASAALLASLALGVARYTAGLSTYARYYTELEEVRPLASTALEIEPRLGLDLEGRTSLFNIAYYPRLLMIADSPPPQFFNQASLSLALHPEPALVLTANASGCYGTNDFRVQYALACGAAAFTTGTAPPPIPSQPTVKYMGAYGAVGARWQPSSPLTIAGTLSWLAQGGADAPTREVLPLQRGPSFLASLEWAPGRDDALITSLSGSYYAFLREAPAPGAEPPSANAWISQAVETWRHAFGRALRLRLGLGVGTTGNASDALHLVLRSTSMVGEASCQVALGPEREPGPPLLDVGARVAPFVDFTSGLAYQLGDAHAALAWPLGRDWRLDASVSAALALDGAQRGQRTIPAYLAVTWIASPWARLSAGLNGLWQQAGANYPASTIRQGGFFLGATFSDTGRL